MVYVSNQFTKSSINDNYRILYLSKITVNGKITVFSTFEIKMALYTKFQINNMHRNLAEIIIENIKKKLKEENTNTLDARKS